MSVVMRITTHLMADESRSILDTRILASRLLSGGSFGNLDSCDVLQACLGVRLCDSVSCISALRTPG
jgi:hypothetical protein